MEILLDTHILIWHLTDNAKLSKEKSNIIENTSNRIFFSMASLWEIAIKTSLGKLEIIAPIEALVPKEITILDIAIPHLQMMQTLPFHHRDPFDRLIIAQAKSENLILMTDDNKFKYYDVHLI